MNGKRKDAKNGKRSAFFIKLDISYAIIKPPHEKPTMKNDIKLISLKYSGSRNRKGTPYAVAILLQIKPKKISQKVSNPKFFFKSSTTS